MKRYLSLAAAGILLAMAPTAPASAQRSGVATVNGESITSRDIDQRVRVSAQLFRKPISREAALQELIDDKVKSFEARRLGMRVTDSHQNDMMNRFAASVRQQPTEFEQNLARAGIESEAVRAKISAEAIWNELLRVRGRNSNISNAELNAELEKRMAQGGAKVTDYVIRQIVFVVPPGSSLGARERDANAARPRFTDCESGVEYMRGLRDVAVKERIGRTSADLSKQTQDLLAKTPVGRLTPPFRTDQGVEMVAVCERNERQDATRLRNEIEQELLQKRSQGSSQQYLNELRAKVDIRR
ncbi:MAG: peptidylprolyl isomerase [Beijerinckiaceae bacterium]